MGLQLTTAAVLTPTPALIGSAVLRAPPAPFVVSHLFLIAAGDRALANTADLPVVIGSVLPGPVSVSMPSRRRHSISYLHDSKGYT